ncbi:MAG: hypothetical protein LBR80_16625 [Deltaproteobacteria bacterium]|jgi:restriction endonuclease Mrr|nr:hypothetical protein [Deltaproteobacteria bacterium]
MSDIRVPLSDFLDPVLTLAGRAGTVSPDSLKEPVLALMGLPNPCQAGKSSPAADADLRLRLLMACDSLTRSGLLDDIGQGAYAITPEGAETLAAKDRPAPRRGRPRKDRSAPQGDAPPRTAAQRVPTPIPEDELNLLVLKALADAASPGLAFRGRLAEPVSRLAGRPAQAADPALSQKVRVALDRLASAGLVRRRTPVRGPGDAVTDDGWHVLEGDPQTLDGHALLRSPSSIEAAGMKRALRELDRAEMMLAEAEISEMESRILLLSPGGFRRLAGELARAAAAAEGLVVMPYRALTPADGPEAASELSDFAAGMKAAQDRDWALFAYGALSEEASGIVSRLSPRVMATDARSVARLMRDLGVGVTVSATAELKRPVPGFFATLPGRGRTSPAGRPAKGLPRE